MIIEDKTYPYFNHSIGPHLGHAPIITTVPTVSITENDTYSVQYEAYDSEVDGILQCKEIPRYRMKGQLGHYLSLLINLSDWLNEPS